MDANSDEKPVDSLLQRVESSVDIFRRWASFLK